MFDTEKSWLKAWKPALSEFGYPDVPEGLPAATRGTSGDSFYAAIHRFFGPEADAKGIRDALSRHAYADIRAHIEKKPGLDELLAWLSDQGVPCAVATSSPRGDTLNNLRRSGIEERFQAVVTGDQITRSKPDPQIFNIAASLIGTEPTHTLVLEDSKQGLRAGHAGGFITVMVPDLTPPDEETDALCDACCASLLEVRDLLASGKLG